jgi:hypothetical protein
MHDCQAKQRLYLNCLRQEAQNGTGTFPDDHHTPSELVLTAKAWEWQIQKWFVVNASPIHEKWYSLYSHMLMSVAWALVLVVFVAWLAYVPPTQTRSDLSIRQMRESLDSHISELEQLRKTVDRLNVKPSP